MARTTKKQEQTKENAPVTRAEKKDATKNLIREILAVKPLKHNELIEEVASLYTARFAGEDTENPNDVKGRVGSVLDIMKKESDVMYDGGMYALKARALPEPTEEKPVKKTRKTAKKAEEAIAEAQTAEPAPKKRGRKPKAEKEQEKTQPLPPAPLQPIAPVAPITPETAPEPIPDDVAPAPKKRGRKPKAKAEETPQAETAEQPKAEESPVQEKQDEPKQLIVKEKAEVAKQNVVMDMSFLFGDRKSAKPPVREEKAPVKAEEKPVVKAESKPASPSLQKTERKGDVSATKARTLPRVSVRKAAGKPLTADEKLREEFLKRLRKLGGEYFEYYSVYLLERYSMKNGRRLEGMKISGGDHDGGIDGEIELTDRLGFRETIYIQSKNWNPDKGDEKLWVVGETLLQQFIGACACRQAKDGKQHCRGIFITTSRFTPEAKRILDTMSDKIVGYDCEDLYEAAKECAFGVVEKNGVWSLDERLLSGTKAFFNLF